VKRKKGSEATVDISDIKSGDAVSVFITQVVAVSCAATHVPETRLAVHNFLNPGFCKALQVDVVVVLITYPTLQEVFQAPTDLSANPPFSRMRSVNPFFDTPWPQVPI
jgi:hypothetical protein